MDTPQLDTGLHYDVPFQTYAEAAGLNPSKLKEGRKSMKHLRHYVDHGKEPTPGMKMGTHIHTAILEPKRFFAEALIYGGNLTKNTKATKGWKEFEAACVASLRVGLLPQEMEDLQGVSNAVHSNREAHSLIESMRHEVSMFWHDHLLGSCKCRIDLLNPDRAAFCDLKSTGSIEPHAMTSTQYKMGTHIQMGWCRWGLQEITGRRISSALIIAIEQKPPYDVAVYDMTTAFLDKGMEEAKEIAQRYRIAQSTSNYPGIAGGERLLLDLPGWVGAGNGVELNIGGKKLQM
jgi:hypothetical protein